MRVFAACAALFVLLALLAAGPAGPVRAGDPAAPDALACTCAQGNACWHWLNAPVAPPSDPCSCPNCREKRGSCPKSLPAGWNAACATSSRMECFLRRHSASWKLTCSDEEDKCACPGADSASCPGCGGSGGPPDPKRFAKIREQVLIERRAFGNEAKFVAITSPHFYLVSDIESLKVVTQTNFKREVDRHELAHIYVQRAEVAYREFTSAFGGGLRTSRRIAIFLNRRKKDSERVQTAYFGRPNAGLVYGIRGANPPISGGFAEAGVAMDLEGQTSDDALHQRLRTTLGHIFVSLWHTDNATESHLPMWVFLGAGHWLGRLPDAFHDQAAFVGGEGNQPTDAGDGWMKRVAKASAGRDFPHVDTFFGFTTLSQTDLTSNMRAWSWFALFLDEDRARFVRFLRLVRDGKNQRESVSAVFGCTSDELEAKWRDRVTGRRKSLVEDAGGASAPVPPGKPASGLADLAKEPDARTIADRIKARKSIDGADDAAILVALLERDSDLVRERVVLALSRATAAPVREFLRSEALAATRPAIRAGIARFLGLAKDRGSAAALTGLLADTDPDVRAQAALALGRIGHEPAFPQIRGLVGDRSDAVAMAAIDALALLGESAADCWPVVAARLDDARRPVRTAAAESLGALGSMASIDALLARMTLEEGRVRADIRDALRRIARDDLGSDPATWKAWWAKERARVPGGGLPARPPEKPKETNPRYATGGSSDTGAFYGIPVFSQRLAFVLDVSSSMSDHILVDSAWLAAAGRRYRSDATKFELAASEIAAAMKGFDPRVEFGIVTFRTEVSRWKDRLVPASAGNVEQALSHLRSQAPPERIDLRVVSQQKTDLVDALRLALGIAPGTSGRPTDAAADELYVMTDGAPTAGDLVESDVLLSWFAETNRLARLRLHVVTFETIDVDTVFLHALADAGGGRFVLIPAAKR